MPKTRRVVTTVINNVAFRPISDPLLEPWRVFKLQNTVP
jgi:hypothetical protein